MLGYRRPHQFSSEPRRTLPFSLSASQSSFPLSFPFLLRRRPMIPKGTRPSRSWSYTALEEGRRWGLLPQLHHFALCNLSLGYHVTPHAGGSERYVSAAHALKCYNVYTRVNNHRNSLLMPLLLNLLPFPVYASTCVCCSMRARSEGSWSTMSTNYRFSQNFPGVEKHDHNNTR